MLLAGGLLSDTTRDVLALVSLGLALAQAVAATSYRRKRATIPSTPHVRDDARTHAVRTPVQSAEAERAIDEAKFGLRLSLGCIALPVVATVIVALLFSPELAEHLAEGVSVYEGLLLVAAIGWAWNWSSAVASPKRETVRMWLFTALAVALSSSAAILHWSEGPLRDLVITHLVGLFGVSAVAGVAMLIEMAHRRWPRSSA